MNLQDAIGVIESAPGFIDETTPVGEAWAVVLASINSTPVPVSERLPGPQDCDAEGRCWWFLPTQQLEILRQSDAWSFRKHIPRKDDYCRWTHWLPAHALPLPSGEVEE